MLELLRGFSVKTLGFLFPFAVRWFYKPESIAGLIKVRVHSEGDGVTYNCGELPSVEIWLTITNLSPFTVELDRMIGQLAYGCVIGEVVHLRRYRVPPSQERLVLINGSLTDSQVRHIKKNLGKMETKLYFTGLVNSRIHNFELTREVSTNNVRHLN